MGITGVSTYSNTDLYNNKTQSTEAELTEAIKKFEDLYKLSAKELKEDKDWRDMSGEEWDKMLEDVDKYIDAFKERLKQMKEIQDKAAQKAAMEADPSMRTIAASSAALAAAASGFESGSFVETSDTESTSTEEGVDQEKNWTKKLKTDDQTILMTAKEAQKMESYALSKLQEVQLTDNTAVGVSSANGVTECASVEEDEKKDKVWTITCLNGDGISSKKCQNGKVLSEWEIKYSTPKDRKNVEDLIAGFKSDANLKFAGIKDFWIDFLKGNISMEDIVQSENDWKWVR
jgi:hypothetical protein